MNKKRSNFVVLGIVLCVFWAALKLIWAILWRFPKMEIPARQAYLQRCALKLLNTMGISLEQQGAAISGQACLRAANHVSWLDILALYACSPCRFIAKAEVEQFPLIGRIAKNAGTLFLNRTSIKDAIRMSRTIAMALKNGDCVAFFPEGTTSRGDGLLPLHASLFESAVEARSHVQTVVLRFHLSGSTRACYDAAYVGNMSIMGTLWRTLRHSDMRILVIGMEPIKVSSDGQRRVICARVQEEMETTLNHLNYNREAIIEAQGGVRDDKTLNQLDFALQEVFFNEAHKIIQAGFLDVEQLRLHLNDALPNKELLMRIRQVFNLLKGSSRMVGFADFGRSAQACEQCLDSWLIAKKQISESVVLFIENALQDFSIWLEDLKQGHIGNMQAAAFEKAAELVSPGIKTPR